MMLKRGELDELSPFYYIFNQATLSYYVQIVRPSY